MTDSTPRPATSVVPLVHGEADASSDVVSADAIFEQHQLTRAEAAELTARIDYGIEHIEDLIKRAYLGRAWLVLGFESWNAWVQHHFGNRRLIQVSREDRQETVASLHSVKMSNRAIATTLGVDERTVRRDISQIEGTGAANAAPDGLPDGVIGQDGKEYPVRRGRTSSEPIDDALCEVCGGHHPESDEDCPVIKGAFDTITVGPTSTADIPEGLRDSAFGSESSRDTDPHDEVDSDDIDSETEPLPDRRNGPATIAQAVTRQTDAIVGQWIKIRDDLEELPGLLDDADALLDTWPADAPMKMPSEVAGDGLAALEAVQRWENSLSDLLRKWERIVDRLDRMTL